MATTAPAPGTPQNLPKEMPKITSFDNVEVRPASASHLPTDAG
jgi:hypothetical protein